MIADVPPAPTSHNVHRVQYPHCVTTLTRAVLSEELIGQTGYIKPLL